MFLPQSTSQEANVYLFSPIVQLFFMPVVLRMFIQSFQLESVVSTKVDNDKGRKLWRQRIEKDQLRFTTQR